MFAAHNAGFSPDSGVLFDAASNANDETNQSDAKSISWSHTASGDDRIVIVVMTVLQTEDNYTTHSRTVTYGGISMSSLGGIHANNNNGRNFVEFYYLFNPPTGSQTVNISLAKSSTTYFRLSATALSYTRCKGVYGSTTGFGTEAGTVLTQTVSALPHERIIQAFITYQAFISTAISGYSQTERFNLSANGGSKDNAMVVGDAPGVSPSVTFDAVRNYDGADYAQMAIKLTSNYISSNVTNTTLSNQPIPSGASGCYVTLTGAGGAGGGGATRGGTGSGNGGGGGGGGGHVKRAYIPRELLGSTYSVTQGSGGSAVGQGTAGNNGGASSFVSGTITLIANGGGGGQTATTPTGGAGGTTSIPGGITYESVANGTNGGDGSTTQNVAGGDGTNSTTNAGAGGGGGGSNKSTASVGGKGGDATTVSGGAAGPANSGSGGTAADSSVGLGGAGGGGGGGGSGFGSNGRTGGNGAQAGAGGGGGGGKEGGTGSGGTSGAGANGYSLIEWV
jgi:hypothetical protein